MSERRGRRGDEIKQLVEAWQIVVTQSPGTAVGTYPLLGVLAANATKVLSTHGATAYGANGVVFTAPRSAYYRVLVRTSFAWQVTTPNGYYRFELVLNGNTSTFSEFIGASVYQYDAYVNAAPFTQVPLTGLMIPVIGEQILFLNAGDTAYPALANILGGFGSAPSLGPVWIEVDSISDSRRLERF